MRRLHEYIRHLARFDTVGNPHVPTLLLHGETGTGKGLIARVVHDSGPRAPGPFIQINCAAIPEALLEAELFGFEAGAFTNAKRGKPGLFEAASGGTLFLDEVDALPQTLQSKLLVAVEEKQVRRLGAVVGHPVDIKLIVATQADLPAAVRAGRFRADLCHRLAVVVLEVPPLRERGADVILLAQHFLQRYAAAHGLRPKRLSVAAEKWLCQQSWPGNVRELGHLMERVTLLCAEAVVEPAMLEHWNRSAKLAAAPPTEPPDAQPLSDEVARLRQALRWTGGNVTRAARLLGLSRKALRYRLRRYGIDRSDLDAWSPPSPPSAVHDGQGSTPRMGEEVGARRDRARQTQSVEGGVRGDPLARASGWEQKPVAVLAIDLTLPRTAGLATPAHAPWTVLGHWLQAITDKVQGFGGMLLQRSPPLMTAAFGLPQSLEQMPHRAVQAALTIRHLIADERWVAGGEVCPEVRLAVHLGSVLVDRDAPDPSMRVSALGDTLALPMRLLGHAAPGEILVSPQVARLVAASFALQERRLRLGAGAPDRVTAHAVVGPLPWPSFPEGAMGRARTPFVGRARELTILHDQLAAVEDGLGQVVGIVGEPGMGKSRLLWEFQQALTARRVTYLEGHGWAYGQVMPYLPVLEIVRQCCGLTEVDPLVGDYLDELYALGHFCASAPGVSHHTFRTFAQRSLARCPGLQALSWNRRVPDAQREAYEAAMRQEGFADFHITERNADGELVRAAHRPEYVVVSYIEPYAGNERAQGFDVASVPDRNNALQQARDTGEPRATGRLTLVQGGDGQFGVLLFLPIYAVGAPPATLEARRQHLQGYVTAVLRIGDLAEAPRQRRQEVIAERVRRCLQTAGMAPDASAPYLLRLLGVEEGTERLSALTGAAIKAGTFETVQQLLLSASRRQPLVLAVENLHWIDQTSAEWLASLVDRLVGTRILLLCTYRPGYRPPWMHKSYATQLTLRPLSPPESLSVVQSVLHREHVPEPLAQAILAKAEGNPLFLEELAQTVTERGDGGADLELPDTLQGVLMARIDALPAAPKRLLQTMAVIGKACSLRLLLQVMGQPQDALLELLRALQQGEFIYEQPAMPEPLYCFKHVLTQEAAYHSLASAQRAHLHRCVAEALTALFQDRLAQHYAELAHHYRRSGELVQAVTYLQQAGQQAVQQSAYQEAITHLTTALELLKSWPDTPERTAREIALLTTLGPVLIATKGHAAPEVEHAYMRARELCLQMRQTLPLFRVLRGLSMLYLNRAELQQVRELAEQRLSLAQQQDDPVLLLGAHDALGAILYHLGEFALARRHLEQGIALSHTQGPQAHAAHDAATDHGVACLGHLAWVLWFLGAPGQALQRSREAIALAQELDHPFSLTQALYWAAHLHQLCRDARGTQERAQAAMAVAAAQGFAQQQAQALLLHGWALAQQGRRHEGLTWMRQGLAGWEATGARLLRPYYLALLAEAYGHGEQVEEALRLLSEALATAHRTGERSYEAELYRLQGQFQLACNAEQHGEAETCFRQALDIARCRQAKSLELRAAMSLSRLWQQRGKRDAARQLLAPICAWFTEGFDTADLREANALLEALA
jgi:transcriptional regulator with AAA-type ATPase domain/predicted ATPase